jgi:hypothetical protein
VVVAGGRSSGLELMAVSPIPVGAVTGSWFRDGGLRRECE